MEPDPGDLGEIYDAGNSELWPNRPTFEDPRLRHIPDTYEGYLTYLDVCIAEMQAMLQDTPRPGVPHAARYPLRVDSSPQARQAYFQSREELALTLQVHLETRERLLAFTGLIELHYAAEEQRVVKKALALAVVGHQHKITAKGRIRKSDGAPYVNHPVAMAGKLLQVHLETPSGRAPKIIALCALLLHDVPEDVPIAPAENAADRVSASKTAWLDAIESEFDFEGQGKTLREVIEAVTEQPVPEAYRAQLRETPLHKTIVAFVERGGVKRPKRGIPPLSERQLTAIDHAVYNLERLFSTAVRSPDHMIALVVKILDLWQNFDTISLVKVEKILRGRIAAATALHLGYPELAGELIAAMATVTDTNTPYSPDIQARQPPTPEMTTPEFVEKRLTDGKVDIGDVLARIARVFRHGESDMTDNPDFFRSVWVSQLRALLREDTADAERPESPPAEAIPGWHLSNPRDHVSSGGWADSSLSLPVYHMRLPREAIEAYQWPKNSRGRQTGIRVRVDESTYPTPILTVESKAAPESRYIQQKLGRARALLQCRLNVHGFSFLVELQSDEPRWRDYFERYSGVLPAQIPESRLFHNRLAALHETAEPQLGARKLLHMQQTHFASLIGFLYDANLADNTYLMQLNKAMIFGDPDFSINDYVIAVSGRGLSSGDDRHLWVERRGRLHTVDKHRPLRRLGIGTRNMAGRIFTVVSSQLEIAHRLNSFSYHSAQDLIISHALQRGLGVATGELAKSFIAAGISTELLDPLMQDTVRLEELTDAIADLHRLGEFDHAPPDLAQLRQLLGEVREYVVRLTTPEDVITLALSDYYSYARRGNAEWYQTLDSTFRQVLQAGITAGQLRRINTFAFHKQIERQLSARYPDGRVQPWIIERLIAAMIRKLVEG